MEFWFDGSADGRRGAWAALILIDDQKPRQIYGTARDIPGDSVDRWAARQVLRRLGNPLVGEILLISDRKDNSHNPVSRLPALTWIWRPRRRPLILPLLKPDDRRYVDHDYFHGPEGP